MEDLPNLSQTEIHALEALLAKLKPGQKARGARHARTIQYLTEEEIGRLFSAIKNRRDIAIFRLAYHRGLRAGEVRRMQFSDLRLTQDRIFIRRLKGSASGEYHLTASEVRALRAWVRVRGPEPGPLFPSRRKQGISERMLNVLMRRYGQAAGIPAEKCHFHALKHSCATHLLNRGESIEDVQDHLGHRNIQNTVIYAKVTNSRRQERDRRLRDW
jgi:integrase